MRDRLKVPRSVKEHRRCFPCNPSSASSFLGADLFNSPQTVLVPPRTPVPRPIPILVLDSLAMPVTRIVLVGISTACFIYLSDRNRILMPLHIIMPVAPVHMLPQIEWKDMCMAMHAKRKDYTIGVSQ